MEFKPLFPHLHLTRPIIIAGPCSVETEEQVMQTAKQLAAFDIKIFRGGIWKPRTSPGSFEGVGERGLPWLSHVKEETEMVIGIEVANKSHVESALNYGIDMLWIGARTTTNPFAVQEIADAIEASGRDVAVLIKNPVNPDLELWVGAFQRIYNAGIRRLGAIHRGFSVYGPSKYRNLPMWQIPIELQRRYPSLPVFCDPSHITGDRALIESVAQQALDMNFAGLIIESHCNPEEALSDRKQQITPSELQHILSNLILRDKMGATEPLNLLRERIDSINDELLELLARRMCVTEEIGLYKKEHEMPVIQPERYNLLMENTVRKGEELGLKKEFVKRILANIHEESVKRQIEIVNDKFSSQDICD